MVRLISFVVFISLSVSAYSQRLGFSIDNNQRFVQVPFELHSNLIVVPVILNGAIPLKFVLDTGVRSVILTQKTFADILNFTYTRKYTLAGVGEKKEILAYVSPNITLQLPGITGNGHSVLVLEEDYLELRNYLGTDVHGILGYDLFSRFVIKVDYERKMLTFYDPNRFKKMKGYQSIPMKIEDTKPYIITPIHLEDGVVINAKLLMDSGASHGLLLDPRSDGRIQIPDHVVSSVIGRGLGGDVIGKSGRIKSFHLGTHALHNVVSNFPDPNSYADTLKQSLAFRNGTVGGELMERFKLVFNFPLEELYFKRNNSNFKKPFYYNLSGVTVKAKGAKLNVFEITEVRKRSVADLADIQPGDIILSMNGISNPNLSLNLINHFFNSKPNKKIRMDIKRNNERLKREIILKDEI
jgi:hypothetical protein